MYETILIVEPKIERIGLLSSTKICDFAILIPIIITGHTSLQTAVVV